MTWNKEGEVAMRGAYRLLTSSDMAAKKPLRELIKGVFPQKGVAIVWGEPEGGKSFVTLDMAAAVSEGREWFGHRVIKAPVIYLALEGAAGFGKRVAAWEMHNGRKISDNVHFVTGERIPGSNEEDGFDLTNPANITHLHMTISAGKAIGGVVIIDTLNRAAPGVDENSSEGMGAIISGLHHLQQIIDGLVIAVHHPGKDLARGMRGHSSLLGSLDASLEVLHSNGERSWKPGKNKDNGKAAPEGFELTVVNIGVDEDGDPVTSCIVTPTGIAKEEKKPQPRGAWQRLAFTVLDMIVKTKGDPYAEPQSDGAPALLHDVAIDAIVEADPNKTARARDCAKRAIADMTARGVLGGTYKHVWFKV